MDALGFSSAEANGAILLVFILFSFIILSTFLQPVRPAKIATDDQSLKEWAAEIEASLVAKTPENPKPATYPQKTSRKRSEVPYRPFAFDPNTASQEDLISNGVPAFLARRMVNYRSKGGSFRKKEDLLKIYDFSDSLYALVEPYVQIADSLTNEGIRDTEFAKKDEEPAEPEVWFELNSANAEELRRIRGIGAVLSSRIVKYRNLLGGFHDYAQLREVWGLKPEVIEVLKNHSVLEPKIQQIPLNTDSIKVLARHPYIDYNLARALVNYRKVHGDYQEAAEIQNIKLMSDSLYQKLSPYLSISH
jgi:DNA uptake protein ComE-like DNA-binding protein